MLADRLVLLSHFETVSILSTVYAVASFTTATQCAGEKQEEESHTTDDRDARASSGP
jgi:hypothetical protein